MLNLLSITLKLIKDAKIYSEKMNRVLITLFFILVLINLSVIVRAGLMIGEGGITLKPLEKKSICGGLCVYSTVNYTTTTYSVVVSKELEKFVDRIEPQDFTLIGIDCPNEAEARRKCIRDLCSQEKTESTQTLCVYFNAPLEISFDMENGIPIAPKEKEYKGGIRAVGKVGVATIVEPLPFYVYYTPLNGWLVVGAIIVVIVTILLIIKLKYKKRKK